jgi:membrane protein DedA with SNARE-associated domain
MPRRRDGAWGVPLIVIQRQLGHTNLGITAIYLQGGRAPYTLAALSDCPPVFGAVFGVSISQMLSDLGYAGLTLLMVAETVFPPIPSEVVLPFAGYLVQQGEFDFVPALIASTTGSLIGAVLLEEAARHGGRPFADRFLRFARQDPAKLDDAERWFLRRGSLVVLLGRCVPGVRSLVALPAGVLRMPRGRYIVLTIIGSTVWNAVLIGAGYVLGTQWERVADSLGPLATTALVLTVIAAAGLVLWRSLRRRRTD